MQKATLILIALFTLLPLGGNAHPGRTAADGCHYCRTNCDSWGEDWNVRHCHGGYVAPPTYTQPTYTPPPAPTPKLPAANEEQRTIATVTEVIDGDTVRIRLSDGTIEKVRIIGMDTPESKDPRKSVECFANEATEHLKVLLNESSNVTTLVRDDISGNRDTYQRLLRHVYIDPPGRLPVNQEYDAAERMIRDGYAYSYTKYPFDAAKMEQYVAAEKDARTNERGLWAPGRCEEDPRVAKYASSNPAPTAAATNTSSGTESASDDARSSATNRVGNESEKSESGDGILATLIAGLAYLGYRVRPSTWKK